MKPLYKRFFENCFHDWKHWVQLFCAATVLLAFVCKAQAQSETGPTGAGLRKSPPVLSKVEEMPIDWREDVGRLVIYRAEQASDVRPMRVYVTDQYHASLLPGTFAELCMSAGAQTVLLAFGNKTSTVSAAHKALIVSGESRYLRASVSPDGRPSLQEATRQEAMREGAEASLNIAQSRVSLAQTCRTEE